MTDKYRTTIASESGKTSPTVSNEAEINASGHVQELRRNFSLVSLVGIALVVGNVWPAIGGSILVAIFNGGPPGRLSLIDVYTTCSLMQSGVLYEFIVVSVFYWVVAACIAELASGTCPTPCR